MSFPTEPVRVYVYTVLAAVVGALVAFGVVDSNLVPVLLALGTAVLGIVGTETARAKVTPVVKTLVPDPSVCRYPYPKS